jgi:hypothetical protein
LENWFSNRNENINRFLGNEIAYAPSKKRRFGFFGLGGASRSKVFLLLNSMKIIHDNLGEPREVKNIECRI